MKLSRRQFLASTAIAPALTCIGERHALADDTAPHQPPYQSLRDFILPGNDDFPGEKIAEDIRKRLHLALKSKSLPGAESAWEQWVASLGEIRRAQFYVLPDDVIRFEVASTRDGLLEYRVGDWRVRWSGDRVTEFAPIEEHLATAREPWFRDVTATALGELQAFRNQLCRGIPYWRARLDPASGIDVYGSNGIAVGDIDGDGQDELYVCQPGGLPNRLFKFDRDGTATDMTAQWKVDLLDDTSCALFLDLRNTGRQDLVVLRSSGPLLFLNEGDHYRMRADAFRFATVPKGGFTGMAAADFDRDGRLDLYLCCYVYFQSEAQYTYASPYHDAQNGPPNFLFRNRLNADGSGYLEDCTEETGMNQNNNRFSFAPAWCDYNGDGWPDLYVANDFGRNNLYRNGNGKFRDAAKEAGVEDIGPGMSASWFDYDHDGMPDLYVANMWTAAGQRVIRDKNFAPAKQAPEAYRAHTMGNSLFHNRRDGTFADVTAAEHVAFGRWAWSSGGHDFDNDGNPEIYVTCGMLTNQSETDLGSFFWRQVVAKSPVTATPSTAYENGWNAINQFLREDYSWNGREPNVFYARRDGRYIDFSGVSGLDFADDSRAFAVFDFDGDGRPDIALKSRMGPQLRLLQNNCAGSNRSIGFRLHGTKSNRDAIGTRIQVDKQTKWLEAGSGFLSQHSKHVLFGLGEKSRVGKVEITWPSGLVQEFADLESGKSYTIVEGSSDVRGEAFRESHSLPSTSVSADNEMRLHDTWMMEPVPLPVAHSGPGVFVIDKPSPEFEVFRRYLFDWRTSLETPFAMLLNASGEMVKVYSHPPGTAQRDADLAKLRDWSPRLGLPFDGFYVKPPKRDFFKHGAAFLWAGYPEQALPYLERVLKSSPENARVLVLVGQIHFRAGRIDEAERSFDKALEDNASAVNALVGLGDIAAKRDQQAKAAEFYARAFQLDSSSPEAANALGLALAKQGQLDQAREHFEQAISLRRDYADAINNLGVLYARQQKMNDAIAAFSYGVRVAPDEDILYLNLGRMYVQMGQRERARAVMQQLLDRKPNDPTAQHAIQELNSK